MHVLCLLLLMAAAAAQKPSLAVVEKIAGFVGFYTADGRRVAGVKVGTHPHEGALSPDRRTLYITDNGILWMTDPGEGENMVSIIDVATMKKTGVIDLGRYRRPHGIAIHPKTGRMAVTIENPDGLLLIDPVKREVLRKYDVQGEDPHMVVFDAAGEWAYASNSATNNVAAVNLATGRTKVIATGTRPQGGLLSRDGKSVYIANSNGNSISIIDTATREVTGTIPLANGPGRLAQTPDGKTLVYNTQAGQAVGFAEVAARKEVAVVPLGGRPLSLTMSTDGKLVYSGVQDQDKIFVLSVAERKILRVIATPKGAGPDPAIPLF